MTNQTPESVIAEVIEYHADTIGSHWDGCYKHHAPCLAVKLRDMLREPGVPEAATEQDECAVPGHTGCTRVMVDGEPWFDHFPAERDAALAAIERVRARLGDILPDWSDSGVIAVADILAALDGAPEPEVKP